MKIRSGLLASLAALGVLGAGMTAGISTAEAGHRHGGFHRHHFHFKHYSPRIYVHSDCEYYYDKWLDTGSRYWKKKYYVCKGWY